MRKKEFLNRVASATLSLVFFLASVDMATRGRAQVTPEPVTPEANATEPVHTYWKVKDYDAAIIDLWRCPENGLCAALHNVDPHDKKMKWLAAKVLKKKEADITDDDVLQFCGYRADLYDMKEDASPSRKTGLFGKWTGKIDITIKGLPRMNGTEVKVRTFNVFNVILEDTPGETVLHARGYELMPLFGHTENLLPVPQPPAGCVISSPAAPAGPQP